MSSYLIIRNTGLELRRLIHGVLSTAPDADLGLGAPEADITLLPPTDDAPEEARLSLYLYHLEVDGHLRNQRPLPDGAAGLRHPPLALLLRYLITPLDDDEQTNHLILGRVVQFFHDQPFVSEIDGTPLGTSFGGASPQLRVSFESLSLESLSRIWNALNTPYRLSVAYLVRVVAVDSDLGVQEAKRVRESHTAVGPMK